MNPAAVGIKAQMIELAARCGSDPSFAKPSLQQLFSTAPAPFNFQQISWAHTIFARNFISLSNQLTEARRKKLTKLIWMHARRCRATLPLAALQYQQGQRKKIITTNAKKTKKLQFQINNKTSNKMVLRARREKILQKNTEIRDQIHNDEEVTEVVEQTVQQHFVEIQLAKKNFRLFLSDDQQEQLDIVLEALEASEGTKAAYLAQCGWHALIVDRNFQTAFNFVLESAEKAEQTFFSRCFKGVFYILCCCRSR